MNCKYCNNRCIKKGYNKNVQRILCKTCNRYQQENYTYNLCTKENEQMIIKLNNEGVGISSISRITGLSKANVVNKINAIAFKTEKPLIKEEQQEYEVDELYTYVKNKSNPCYVIYALNKSSKKVIDFFVGSRTKENINKVITSVKALNPKKIFTDKLNIYPALIEESIHTAASYKINHIERFNLTLRTHQKRLTRKTICYSKTKGMLENCLRIYFWSKV